MCRHKMQLEFICIISGFSKFSAVITYCCHDENLELGRACFCSAIAISNFTLPLEITPNVPLMPVLKKKKKLWKSIIIQTQRKEIRRLALRYVKIVQPFIYLGVEMFCLEEGDGWCLPQTPRSG